MAKTKDQLRTENNANFPNNNSQFITPEKLRGFNEDIIDSVALENDTQMSGTGSFNNLSGSGFVSASQFVGDGSKLTGVSSTVPSGTVSGSSQIILTQTDSSSFDTDSVLEGSNLYYTDARVKDKLNDDGIFSSSEQVILTDTFGDIGGSRITGSVDNAISSSFATTASYALNAETVDTGSLLSTASVNLNTITFTKGDASTFDITVDTGSATIDTGSFATTGSNVFSGSQGILPLPGDTFANLEIGLPSNPIAFPNVGVFTSETEYPGYIYGSVFVHNDYVFGNPGTGVEVQGSSGNIFHTMYLDGEITLQKTPNSDYLFNMGTSIMQYSSSGDFYIYPNINVLGGMDVRQKGTFFEGLEVQNGFTASIAEGSIFVGNSSNVTSTVTTSSLFTNTNSRLDNIESLTGSLLETGSSDFSTITFTKVDGTTFEVDATPRQVIEAVKNGNGQTLPKGTPVYASGSVGNAQLVFPASASDATTMPAVYVLAQSLTAGEEGFGYTHGFINSVDTSAFSAGDPIYVDVNGGYTNVPPTGSNLIQKLGTVVRSDASNGSGVIQIDSVVSVPNIAEGNLWIGNGNGVAQSYSTSSINLALTDTNNTFTGTQTFDNISVNGTGSFAYIESVTGSAKVIGDAFIILNNDTPAERYAGIRVQDSGSTADTASFIWDGQTNDWFYEYSGSDATDYAVAMFGPEYNTQGTPTYLTNNTIPKGDGGHHLNDSSITDDGAQVTVNNPLDVQGNITTTGTVDGVDIQSLSGNVSTNTTDITNLEVFTASQETKNTTLESVTSSIDSRLGQLEVETGSIEAEQATQDGRLNNLETTTSSLESSVGQLNSFTSSQENLNSTFATTGSNTFTNIQTISGSNASLNELHIGSTVKITDAPDFVNKFGPSTLEGIDRIVGNTDFSGSQFWRSFTNDRTTIGVNGSNQEYRIGFGTDFNSTNYTYSFGSSSAEFNAPITYIGTQTISGSAKFEVTTPSIASETASVDFNESSIQTITLVSGSTTHIDATNIDRGQTINVLVKQPSVGTGTIQFAPKFLQSSGSEYTPTPLSDAQDILTFITFDSTTQVYVSNITKFE